MNTFTKITIPCHWDKSILRRVSLLPQDKGVTIGEVYGALAKGGPVGHGRSSISVVNIDPQKAIEYRNYLRVLGLKFTYLLNAPFKLKKDTESKKLLKEYLIWVLQKLKPDAVTIASLELMQEVRKIDQKIAIHISTIAGVKNADEMMKYLSVHPNRIIPHHDLGKNWRSLSEMVQKGKKYGIEVEIMATESCLLHCPNREAHYRCFSGQELKDSIFHTSCNRRKIINPKEFLLAGGIIRPEDIHFYEELGVKYIKITGRSKPSGWLPEVAEAYLNRSYEGNIIRLLGIDPSLRAEDWIFLDNKHLNGFMAQYPHDKSYSFQKKYCNDWILNLYKNGAFRIKDGINFNNKNGNLILNTVKV